MRLRPQRPVATTPAPGRSRNTAPSRAGFGRSTGWHGPARVFPRWRRSRPCRWDEARPNPGAATTSSAVLGAPDRSGRRWRAPPRQGRSPGVRLGGRPGFGLVGRCSNRARAAASKTQRERRARSRGGRRRRGWPSAGSRRTRRGASPAAGGIGPNKPKSTRPPRHGLVLLGVRDRPHSFRRGRAGSAARSRGGRPRYAACGRGADGRRRVASNEPAMGSMRMCSSSSAEGRRAALSKRAAA